MADTLKKKPLSDDEKIAKARLKLTELQLNADDTLQNLLDKYGVFAYSFLSLATATPQQISEQTALPFMSSKVLILYFADNEISDDILAKSVGKSVEDIKTARAKYFEDKGITSDKIRQSQNFAEENVNRMAEKLNGTK